MLMDVKQRNAFIIGVLASLWAVGCTHTKAGTHVEVIEMNGRDAYVSGAVGIGKSKTLACRLAIQRAAKAVAHRFAQERDGAGDEVAEAVGAEDGAAFLHGFVNSEILSMPVQDVTFDPSEHTCYATVRWQPPVFLKQALMKYAEKVKAAEVEQKAAPAANSAQEVQEPATAATAAQSPAAPAKTAATATVAAKPAVCVKEKNKVKAAYRLLGEKEASFNECKRRTDGDADVCYRYGLYVDKAVVAKDQAELDLKRCKDLEK